MKKMLALAALLIGVFVGGLEDSALCPSGPIPSGAFGDYCGHTLDT